MSDHKTFPFFLKLLFAYCELLAWLSIKTHYENKQDEEKWNFHKHPLFILEIYFIQFFFSTAHIFLFYLIFIPLRNVSVSVSYIFQHYNSCLKFWILTFANVKCVKFDVFSIYILVIFHFIFRLIDLASCFDLFMFEMML